MPVGKKSKRAHIDPTVWKNAMDAVRSGMSFREACRRYKISGVNSLRRRFSGHVQVEARPGRQANYLSKSAEQGIVEAVEFRARRGMCCDLAQLRYLVRQVALCVHKDNPSVIPLDFPNSRWTQRFLKRHPSVSMRKAQVFEKDRHDATSEQNVRSYFQNLRECMKRRGYSADCIFNADETGMTPQGRRPPRVICPRGLRANYIRSSDRENVTMMGCCSAGGGSIPPMYVFAGKKRQEQWLEGAVPGSCLAMSESSMIQRPIFKGWLQFFVKETAAVRENGTKPALLLLDGHFAHIHSDFITIAANNNIGT